MQARISLRMLGANGKQKILWQKTHSVLGAGRILRPAMKAFKNNKTRMFVYVPSVEYPIQEKFIVPSTICVRIRPADGCLQVLHCFACTRNRLSRQVQILKMQLQVLVCIFL